MQRVNTRPVFEHEKDEEFKSQVEKLVENKLAEKAEKLEVEKQKSAKEKLEEIRKGLKPHTEQHIHEVSGAGDCPTCKGHTLTVKDDTAKCSGPNCGKEFLLTEKVKNIERDKKKFVCATCGHSVSKAEAEKIKQKDVCPSCGIGKAFFDLAWDKLDSAIKDKTGYNKV